ncbi:MAG: carboxypeptidase M32 [Patescibacteria group bacterium]|nr:carboxypeptidase M32 [Patescibacteria group bacterium]
MVSKNKKIQELLSLYKEIYLLGKISAVLGYDMNVSLPEAAADGRAAQSAYVTQLISEKWLSKKLRNLLEEVENESDLTETEKAIIRNLNWQGKYYFKVPQSLVVEFSKTTSQAFMAWQKAKREDSFADFLPHLKKVVNICQLIADHLGYKGNPYDALLDLYEPGLTFSQVKAIFDELRSKLKDLLKSVQGSKKYNEIVALSQKYFSENANYPVEHQRQIALFVARKLGYDFTAGRLDVSAHPFTETLGRDDVRITTRYKVNDFRDSLASAIHEVGHALYEQGVLRDYEYTPIDGGVSLGIHESQSRFWENQIGRSYEFISFIEPILHTLFNDQVGKADKEELHLLFNIVKPSLIRVEADEVTYNLHIALRFEIEEALINKKIKPEDLPGIWREKMRDYLGVVPETDREGVLQDVHWSYGSIGYFPTYTLGNLYAAQFANAMRKEINFAEKVSKGEFGAILSWLRSNIHQHGSLYWPSELCKRITGEDLNPNYLLDYLQEKYTNLYLG